MEPIVQVPYKLYPKEFEGRPGIFNLFVESVKIPKDSVTPIMWMNKEFKEALPFSFHQSKDLEGSNITLEMSVPLSESSVTAVMNSFLELNRISETVH